MKLLRPLLLSAILLLGSTLSGHSAQEMGNGVCETTATSGTGTVNLAGTYPPYSTFVSQITSGASVTYRITTGTGASIKVETGTGTFTDGAPDTLTRDAEWTTDDQSAPITELTLAGTSTVCLTTAKSTFLGDKGDITFGAGFTTATVDADSVALTTDTTGNYAAGDAEAGAALTGDSATSFFSAGTIEDARIDGSAEVDEITLAGDVDGTGNSNDLDEANVEAELEGVLDLGDMQGDLTGTRGVSITGDIYSSTNGSSSGAPRTWGFGDLTVDEYARIQYGDPYNAFQSGYGQRSQIYAYHGVEIVGARAAATALGFTGGGSGADPSLSVIGNGSSSALWVEGGQVSLNTGLGIEFNAATDSTFTCASGACTIEGATVAELGSIALGTDTTGNYAASGSEGGSATSVAANSVALTTDTTGNYAAGDAEAGAALTGDTATAFFSAGTVDDARIDGSAEADEVNPTLGTQTQGNYVDNVTGSATTGVAVTHTPAEGSEPAVAFDYTDKGASPSLSADTCVFSGDATTNGEIVCEGDTADTIESRIVVTDPTGADVALTIPNANSYPITDRDYGDWTISASGQTATIDGDSVALTTDTTGNYAAGDAEAGAALTGDSATSFFSAGTIEDARIDGSAEADEVLNSDKTDFTCTAGACTLDADVVAAAEMADADHGDISWSAGVASVDGNSVALTTDTTGNYAAGDGEAGNALTGDSATSFFSSGTIEDARIDGSAEADEVLNSDKGDFTCTTGSCAIDSWPTLNRQIVTGTGTYTPTSGAISFFVRCQAAGGGGGGSDNDVNGMSPGAGGGGGQYAEIHYTLAEMGANAAVTIGAVGSASDSNGGAGGAAGDTTFNPAGSGGTLTVDGGGGGDGSGASNTSGYYSYDRGGAGGSVASGGDFEVDGQNGDHPYWASVYDTHKNNSFGGNGGDAFLGHGGRMADGLDDVGTDIAGVTGQSYGGGGSGAADDDTTGSAGGAGGPAICIIDELLEG
jgi:hypothetical protein